MEENTTLIPVEEETVLSPEAEEAPAPETPKLGMKWHGFLCFWLPFSGITGIIGSIVALISTSLMINSLLDKNPAEYIVSEYIRYILLLAFSILMIIVWVGLHKFRRGAPKFYMLLSGLYTLAMSVPSVISNLTLGIPIAQALLLLLPSYVFQAIYLWLNHIYFRKRAHLYVN